MLTLLVSSAPQGYFVMISTILDLEGWVISEITRQHQLKMVS